MLPRMSRRHLWPTVAALGGLLTVLAVFIAPAGRAGLLVSLITGLAWPLAILVAVVVFWPQLQPLLAVLLKRVHGGAGVRFGPISVDAAAERVPSPPPTGEVTLANIALLHTSFLSVEGTKRLSDGRTYYQFEVVVIAPDDVMNRITSVTYELEKVWSDPVREVTDRASRFKLKELANGTTIVLARIHLRGQTEPLLLNRFIDLQPDGPRI
jgi:hypothetical protein